MGIVIDIIVLAILALSIFLGYKKGLINVVFNLCAFLVAFILTWILFTPVSNLIINNTEFDDNIKNTIIEKGVVEDENTPDTTTEEQKGINKVIDNYVSKTVNDAKNNVVKSTAQIIAEKIVAIVVAIGLFLVIRIALIFVKFIANGLAELPLIKQFNKAGGLIYGIIRGCLVIYVLFAICFIIMSINNVEAISTAIDASFISKFIYNNNIILDIIF